jgi:hypothetical protein
VVNAAARAKGIELQGKDVTLVVKAAKARVQAQGSGGALGVPTPELAPLVSDPAKLAEFLQEEIQRLLTEVEERLCASAAASAAQDAETVGKEAHARVVEWNELALQQPPSAPPAYGPRVGVKPVVLAAFTASLLARPEALVAARKARTERKQGEPNPLRELIMAALRDDFSSPPPPPSANGEEAAPAPAPAGPAAAAVAPVEPPPPAAKKQRQEPAGEGGGASPMEATTGGTSAVPERLDSGAVDTAMVEAAAGPATAQEEGDADRAYQAMLASKVAHERAAASLDQELVASCRRLGVTDDHFDYVTESWGGDVGLTQLLAAGLQASASGSDDRSFVAKFDRRLHGLIVEAKHAEWLPGLESNGGAPSYLAGNSFAALAGGDPDQ